MLLKNVRTHWPITDRRLHVARRIESDQGKKIPGLTRRLVGGVCHCVSGVSDGWSLWADSAPDLSYKSRKLMYAVIVSTL